MRRTPVPCSFPFPRGRSTPGTAQYRFRRVMRRTPVSCNFPLWRGTLIQYKYPSNRVPGDRRSTFTQGRLLRRWVRRFAPTFCCQVSTPGTTARHMQRFAPASVSAVPFRLRKRKYLLRLGWLFRRFALTVLAGRTPLVSQNIHYNLYKYSIKYRLQPSAPT